MSRSPWGVSVGVGPVRFFGPIPGGGILAGLIIGLALLLFGCLGNALFMPEPQPQPSPTVTTTYSGS